MRQSATAPRWLQGRSAKQIFFQYRSTFLPTNRGNIGPVANALLDATSEDFTVVCPVFPNAGRTLFQGHLFHNNLLLSKSFMSSHLMTPMKQSNLIKVLSRKTKHQVDLVPNEVMRIYPEAIRNHLKLLRNASNRFAIVDAVSDRKLVDAVIACHDMKLITGSSDAAMAAARPTISAILLKTAYWSRRPILA